MQSVAVIGVLLVSGAPALPLRELDALWMARSIWGEEGARASYEAAAAIASTMLRRWAAVSRAQVQRNQSPPWPTLEALVVGGPTGGGYSTPVQAWREQTPHRVRARSLAWAEIPESIRRAVEDLFTGRIPLTQPGSGAVHFAAPYLVREKLPQNPDWRVVPSVAANELVSDEQGRQSPEPRVVAAVHSWTKTFAALGLFIGASLALARWV